MLELQLADLGQLWAIPLPELADVLDILCRDPTSEYYVNVVLSVMFREHGSWMFPWNHLLKVARPLAEVFEASWSKA